MLCSWCSKELDEEFVVEELHDCYDGRFFGGLHPRCARKYFRVNKAVRIESSLAEMIGFFLIQFQYSWGSANDDYLWVL